MSSTADPVDEVLLSALQVEAGRGVLVRGLEGLDHLVDGDAVGAQAFGAEDDLVLLRLAAGGDDLGHPGNGEEALSQHPVGRRLQLHGVVLVGRERDEEDLPHDRGDGGERWSVGAGWQRRSGELELLGHDLPGLVDVGAPVKLHPDDGDPHGGCRTHPAHPRRTVERGLDGEGDLGLGLLRRHAMGFRDDRDRGRGQIREDVHGHVQGRVAARDEEQRRAEQHEEAVVEGPADDAVDHGRP
jgi:hypothetical protein